MVPLMSDDLDPFLKKIFAEAEPPLEDHAFMRELLAELQRVQRGRTRRRMALAVAAVLAAFGVMPTVLEQTASFVRFTVSWMDNAPSPVCWTVSTFIGIWVMVRTGRPGRR
jgi:phage tail sheath gpL-like